MIKKIGDVSMIHLSDSDSNIYVVGNTVIDAGTGLNFTRMMDMFKIMGKKMDEIEWVVNTHGHFDHVGGNGFFFDAKIAIHESDADVVEKGDQELSFADFFDGSMKAHKIEKRLKDGDEISGLKVIHTPGHSPGSICLYDEKNKILFSGDTVIAEGRGRTDLPGGSEEEMKKSIEKLKGLKIEKLLPGHGNPVLSNVKMVLDKVSEDFY
ncbi:MAG: MBL fold metallo-hydrolase [Candidatus Aenigmarchaeota archaeon]|nr:MBL fold metallo-hydrolase [Candidatus Aenigmarchaeota archaeon]